MGSRSFAKIILGQVIESKLPDAAKVLVTRLVLDKYVMQYFPIKFRVFAFDHKQVTRVGDVVLVKELDAQRTPHITHKIEKIIYSIGNVRDPLTGMRCDSQGYWDEDEREKMFKETPEEQTGLEETFAERRGNWEFEKMKDNLLGKDKEKWKI